MIGDGDSAQKPKSLGLHCQVDGVHVDEQYARVAWPLVSKYPISYEEYQKLQAEVRADNAAVDPHQPTENEWPALFHRYGVAELLIERGRFNWNEVFVVLYGHFGDHAEIERRVVLWLSGELQKLPKGKDALGASPVRMRGLLSPLQIADIAMAMLDYNYIGDRPPPTPELIELFGAVARSDSPQNGFCE